MSMVGYILGLGDRHPSNLMLDRVSGKIIHIDFGDCFEVAMQRDKYPGKYSKRRRSNIAVIIDRIVCIISFLFYCLLLNHSLPTNPNKITNCFKLLFLFTTLQTTFAQCVAFLRKNPFSFNKNVSQCYGSQWH